MTEMKKHIYDESNGLWHETHWRLLYSDSCPAL